MTPSASFRVYGATAAAAPLFPPNPKEGTILKLVFSVLVPTVVLVVPRLLPRRVGVIVNESMVIAAWVALNGVLLAAAAVVVVVLDNERCCCCWWW